MIHYESSDWKVSFYKSSPTSTEYPSMSFQITVPRQPIRDAFAHSHLALEPNINRAQMIIEWLSSFGCSVHLMGCWKLQTLWAGKLNPKHTQSSQLITHCGAFAFLEPRREHCVIFSFLSGTHLVFVWGEDILGYTKLMGLFNFP